MTGEAIALKIFAGAVFVTAAGVVLLGCFAVGALCWAIYKVVIKNEMP